MIGNYLTNLAVWGVSQTSVQRVLSARSLKDAQLLVLKGGRSSRNDPLICINGNEKVNLFNRKCTRNYVVRELDKYLIKYLMTHQLCIRYNVKWSWVSLKKGTVSITWQSYTHLGCYGGHGTDFISVLWLTVFGQGSSACIYIYIYMYPKYACAVCLFSVSAV